MCRISPSQTQVSVVAAVVIKAPMVAFSGNILPPYFHRIVVLSYFHPNSIVVPPYFHRSYPPSTLSSIVLSMRMHFPAVYFFSSMEARLENGNAARYLALRQSQESEVQCFELGRYVCYRGR